METLYKPIFIFSKNVDDLTQRVAIAKFIELRKFAVEALNPMYEQWNEEFEKVCKSIVKENDKLKDYGGTKYCKFIQRKSREILKQVNEKHLVLNWYFDCDEIGDIIFRNKYDKKLTMTLEFEPVIKD